MAQVRDAASVHLSFKGKSDEWLDFYNPLRINGVWEDRARPPPTAAREKLTNGASQETDASNALR